MIYYACIATWRDGSVECKLFSTREAADRRMEYYKVRDSIPVLKVETAILGYITTLETWIKPQDNSRLAMQKACQNIANVVSLIPR